jgi:hypothetical protein
MTIYNYKHFANEIQYNLDIMQKTISNGQGDAIDLGFIEIFRADIAELQQSSLAKKKINQLSSQLEESAVLLQAIWNNEFSACELTTPTQPFYRPTLPPENKDSTKKTTPRSSVTSKKADYVSAGYQKLRESNSFFLRKIPGDGHCLFTSIAFIDLYTAYKNESDPKLLTAALKYSKTRSKQARRLQKAARKVIKLLNKQSNQALHPRDLLLNKNNQEKIVCFLRLLSCHELRHTQHENEVLQSYLAVEGVTLEEYCTRMENMQEAAHGDEPELQALNQALNLELPVLDVQAIGKGEARLPADQETGTLYLLFRPGHYDVAQSR